MAEFRLLSVTMAALRIGKNEDWLRGKIRRGQGPRVVKVSPRCIQIRSDDLDKWLESLPTAELEEIKATREGDD